MPWDKKGKPTTEGSWNMLVCLLVMKFEMFQWGGRAGRCSSVVTFSCDSSVRDSDRTGGRSTGGRDSRYQHRRTKCKEIKQEKCKGERGRRQARTRRNSKTGKRV